MSSITVRIKQKSQAWHGLTATVEAASTGEAIDRARLVFAETHGELAFKGWELAGFAGDVVLVRPTGSWA